jgi:hypothetical protein
MENEIKNVLNYFDRAKSSLHDLPDVIRSKETTVTVIPPMGIGSHTYVVVTFRQREIGDSIFLQVISEGNATRIVIPPAIADVIARQRDQLTGKSRSRASKRVAEDLAARGIKPGFMRKKKGGK